MALRVPPGASNVACIGIGSQPSSSGRRLLSSISPSRRSRCTRLGLRSSVWFSINTSPQGIRKEGTGNNLGGFVVERWTDVAVHAERDRDHRVAEALLYDTRVNAALEGDGGPGVAEAVEGEPLQAVAANSAEELLADCVGM